MKNIFKNTIIIVLLLIFQSCVIGRKMSFEKKQVTTDYPITKSLAIGFQENRNEVLSGQQKSSFCGKMMSTAQIGYNMQTESGKALMEEFTSSVAHSLQQRGVIASELPTAWTMNTDSLINLFQQGDKERLVLFTVNKWESRGQPLFSSIRYEVDYNIDLIIYDRSGRPLVSKNTHDHIKEEKSDIATNLKYLQKMSDDVFESQMKALLNNPDVKDKLQ
jgi:hypothetical protein